MPGAVAPALTVFAVLGVVLAVIDARTHRLPDAVLVPGAGVVLVLLGGAAVAVGEPLRAIGVVGGAAGAFFACLGVHLARPAAFGGGDVKLAGLCGAVLGWIGPDAVASGIALGFVAGGVAASAALLAGMRGASIAFGPYLLVGTWGRLLAGP